MINSISDPPIQALFLHSPNVRNWPHHFCCSNWNLQVFVAVGGPLVPQLITDMPTFYDYDITGEMILDGDGNPQTNERVDLYWLLVQISAITAGSIVGAVAGQGALGGIPNASNQISGDAVGMAGAGIVGAAAGGATSSAFGGGKNIPISSNKVGKMGSGAIFTINTISPLRYQRLPK